MTTQAYRPLTTAEQIFKDLVWDPGVKVGELALEGSVHILTLPIIHMVEEDVIQAISDYLFQQFVLLIDISAIQLVNKDHQAAFEQASFNLSLIAQQKGVDSDEFKKAREADLAALSKFTQYGGQ